MMAMMPGHRHSVSETLAEGDGEPVSFRVQIEICILADLLEPLSHPGDGFFTQKEECHVRIAGIHHPRGLTSIIAGH